MQCLVKIVSLYYDKLKPYMQVALPYQTETKNACTDEPAVASAFQCASLGTQFG